MLALNHKPIFAFSNVILFMDALACFLVIFNFLRATEICMLALNHKTIFAFSNAILLMDVHGSRIKSQN